MNLKIGSVVKFIGGMETIGIILDVSKNDGYLMWHMQLNPKYSSRYTHEFIEKHCRLVKL